MNKQKEAKMMYSIKDKILNLFFYGEIRKKDYDEWSGKEYDAETSATYTQRILNYFEGDFNIIKVYLKSNGGSLEEGLAVYNILARQNVEIETYNDGTCASAASIIMQAGNKRKMAVNGTLMIHNAAWICAGTPAQLRKYADDLEIISNAAAETYLEKSNGKITKEELLDFMDKETFFTAEECLNYGLIDEIITSNTKSNDAEATNFNNKEAVAVGIDFEKLAKFIAKEVYNSNLIEAKTETTEKETNIAKLETAEIEIKETETETEISNKTVSNAEMLFKKFKEKKGD